MKLLILKTGTLIEPLGDDAGDALALDTTLQGWQVRAAQECGLDCEVVDSLAAAPPGPFVLAFDYVLFSRQILQDFLAAARGRGPVTALAVIDGPMTRFTAALSGTETRELAHGGQTAVSYDLFAIDGAKLPAAGTAAEIRHALREHAAWAITPCEEITELRPLPHLPGAPAELAVPRGLSFVCHIRSWVHIVWANQILVRLRLREIMPPKPRGLRQRWRLRHASRAEIAATTNVYGTECQIHPDTYLEGCIIGDNVMIQSGAFLRDCYIGDNAVISDHTCFTHCVVSRGCHTLSDSYFVGCACYPSSTLANLLIRESLLGSKLFITSGVIAYTDGFDGPVQVMHEGRWQTTGRHVLGVCLGHGVMLGTRAIFEPGRAVPNRYMIVMRPEEGVMKIPTAHHTSLREPWIAHEGAMRPLTEAAPPGFVPPETESLARRSPRGLWHAFTQEPG